MVKTVRCQPLSAMPVILPLTFCSDTAATLCAVELAASKGGLAVRGQLIPE
jgi:hypothetical protein